MTEPKPLTTAEKTLRGIRHIGSARVVTQLITWGLTVVTIHLLQPRDYGLIATAGIITALGQLVFDGGLREVLVAQKDLPQKLQGAAVSAVLLTSSTAGAAIFLMAPAGATFFRAPALRSIIEVSAFYLPLTSLEVVPSALLSKDMKFTQIAIVQTASSVLQGLATLGLAYLGYRYWALIFGNFIGSALRVSFLWLSLERKPTPNLRLRALRPLARSSGHMIGQRLTYFSIDNFDLFLLSRFGGPAVLGPYSVARNLAHSVLNQIGRIMNQVLVPAFATTSGNAAQIRGLLFVTSVASAFLFPLFWFIGVTSQVAFPLVFGARWNNLVIPFLAFSSILPLRSLYVLLNASVIGTGRTGTTFRNTLSWALIILPLMLVGVFKGANGVALSWTVGFPLVFYVATRRFSAAFAERITTLLKPTLIPAVCAMASALAAESLLWAPSRLLSSPLLLACQCTVAILCYWLLFKNLGRTQYTQAVSTLRRLIRN